MAKAYKCDRCGDYYDPYIRQLPNGATVNRIIFANENEYSDDSIVELCPKCMGEIVSLLKKENLKPLIVTNGEIYADMCKEFPNMFDTDWRPCGKNKIRVWGNGAVYIYDYETKKLYEDGAN